jgi:hypothetical protein
MQTSSLSFLSKLQLAGLLFGLALSFGCQKNVFQPEPAAPPAMKSVPAVRLNYRYEADVPAPAIDANARAADRNSLVQSDFDNNRGVDEMLERTLLSPDNKHILAVYRNIADVIDEYRLDMYSPDGKLQKKITADAMAVHFPDTIVWSPDSTSLAFVAMMRAQSAVAPLALSPLPHTQPSTSDNSNAVAAESKVETATAASTLVPTPAAPTGILTFRTEQIYICGADGSNLKPVTENEGLIYFYYAWSPDSSMLAALATTAREWKYADVMAASKGEAIFPLGRLRIIEKNGRERRLDDNLTGVHPVWSPDSAKVAEAFETQVRIYDAGGTNPTQAAIPLRNQLLISSQAYDREQQRQALQGANSDTGPISNIATPDQPLSTLPDEKLLVSYNPIVELLWPDDNTIYLKTAYVKRMKNEADNVTSFARWHRLTLSIQPSAPAK